MRGIMLMMNLQDFLFINKSFVSLFNHFTRFPIQQILPVPQLE